MLLTAICVIFTYNYPRMCNGRYLLCFSAVVAFLISVLKVANELGVGGPGDVLKKLEDMRARVL